MEVYEDVLYGGIEGGSSTGILARWNTSTLEIINYKFIDEQRGVPWVTVNPETGYLYASEWNNMDVIHVYDTANQEFPLVEKLTIATPETYPKEIQGASFYQGDLYLATNIEDSIYRINVTTGVSDFVFSDNESYLIDNYYYEMEGLTFWDLSADGLGVMHMYGNFMNVREKAIHSFSP